MKLKGKAWIPGKPVSKNTLYEIRTPRALPFEEVQKDGSKDTVAVNFEIDESQKGFYAEEFRSPFVDTDGCKKTDIFAMVVDDDRRCFKSFIYDVKENVGGEDVIFKLIEQWIDSIQHKNSLSAYLQEYSEDMEVGVITRQHDEARIRTAIDKKKARQTELADGPDTIAKVKTKQQLWKLEEELKRLTLFQDRKFRFYNEVYSYVVHISKERDAGNYHYDLRCNLI